MMAQVSVIACALRVTSPRSSEAIARRMRSRAVDSMIAISWCGLASSVALLAPVCLYWLARLRAFMARLVD